MSYWWNELHLFDQMPTQLRVWLSLPLLCCYYMALLLLKRIGILRVKRNQLLWPPCSRVSTSRALAVRGGERVYSVSSNIHLSPLFPDNYKACGKDYEIELMDDETWHVSRGLKEACVANEKDEPRKVRSPSLSDQDYGDTSSGDIGLVSSAACKMEYDFDDIEDMRIRGNLFYKLDKDSREYEEYKFDFHRRKSLKNEKDMEVSIINKKKESSSCKVVSLVEKSSKRAEKTKKHDEKGSFLRDKDAHITLMLHRPGDSSLTKKQRVPTFNQLTAPYHEPFCLDIYISKSSVRASVIHRATSNVVASAHSISKDMKFDMESTKNRGACTAVGEVLAQRALADDIHNVVYTPRRGEKLEGKLQIVLKSIIDCGVDVKLKLKQKKSRKGRIFPVRTGN